MQNPKICIPITAKTKEEFLKNLKLVLKKSDLVELRLDYIEELKSLNLEEIDNFISEVLKLIKSNKNKKAICTVRKKTEGGEFKGTEAKRLKIIELALKKGFDYLDVENASINKISKIALNQKAKKTKIICSYHDFKKTPNYKKLEEIFNKIKQNKPDIIKMVFMVNDKIKDNQNLFQLLINKVNDQAIKQDLIVLGMGGKGKSSRILSPLLGAHLTFASFKDNKSAPGQISFDQLVRIYKMINL
jgi:3-dehydroquinate dehydratase-1